MRKGPEARHAPSPLKGVEKDVVYLSALKGELNRNKNKYKQFNRAGAVRLRYVYQEGTPHLLLGVIARRKNCRKKMTLIPYSVI